MTEQHKTQLFMDGIQQFEFADRVIMTDSQEIKNTFVQRSFCENDPLNSLFGYRSKRIAVFRIKNLTQTKETTQSLPNPMF